MATRSICNSPFRCLHEPGDRRDADQYSREKGLFGYEPNGIAIRGYDTVAYFTDSAPIKGASEFSTEWKDAIWHFASQQHLDAFNDDQERYAPQFGGYCAYGVSQGYLGQGRA